MAAIWLENFRSAHQAARTIYEPICIHIGDAPFILHLLCCVAKPDAAFAYFFIVKILAVVERKYRRKQLA